MIRIKDHKTRYMFDRFGYLGQKRKQLLETSWAGVFRDHVRPILPVHLLAGHFSENMGRPTNELVAMMGTMILQQMHDLSDEETVNQFAFNIQWHYAEDITGKSDKDAYVSPKSIWNIRHIMSEHNHYRFRADVETTMSQFDRLTWVKYLRVRGLQSVRLCAFLKATGINIFRTAAFKRRQNVGTTPPNVGNSPSRNLFSILHSLFQLVKERFTWKMTFHFRKVFRIGLGFQV